MRISDWSSDVCSSDLATLNVTPKFRDPSKELLYRLLRNIFACATKYEQTTWDVCCFSLFFFFSFLDIHLHSSNPVHKRSHIVGFIWSPKCCKKLSRKSNRARKTQLKACRAIESLSLRKLSCATKPTESASCCSNLYGAL